MTDNPVVTAIDLYARMRAAFDRDEHGEAAALAQRFEALDYAFVRPVRGAGFQWRTNAVCIVAHRELAATRALVAELAPLAADPDYCFVLVSNAADDLFPYADYLLGGRFLGLITGANFGASAGRNAAARFAEADNIVFVDDDGLTTPADMRKLVETRARYDAAGIRGRIVARSDFDELPRHYDLGSGLRQRYIDIEGLSLWTTAALRAARFDVLLFGHEGIDLTARLYPGCGPDAFLYEPAAAMRHDFAAEGKPADAKRARMERNEAYLAGKPGAAAIKRLFETFDHDDHASTSLAGRARLVAHGIPHPASDTTVLTLCDRDPGSIDACCEALAGAMETGARLLIAAGGEGLAAARAIADRLGGRGAVRLVETEAASPAAMFAASLRHLDTPFAIIASPGQTSIRQRIGWTMAAFDIDPDADMAGFLLFDAETGSRSALPRPTWREDMATRCLFGAPCEFGALAFRVDPLRSLAPEAAADFGWLHDGLLGGALRGTMFPVGISFLTDPDRRPAADRQFEADFRARAVTRHRALLNDRLDAYDEEAVDYAVGARAVPTDISLGRLRSYAARMIAGLALSDDPRALDQEAALTRLVAEADLRRLRTDVVRMQTRMKKVEMSASELPKAQEELEKAREKLEWNRDQVSDLKEKLSAATAQAARFDAHKKELASHDKRLDEAERRIRSLEREVRKPSLARRILRRLRGT